MFNRHALVLAILLSSCGKASSASEDKTRLGDTGWQSFTLGAMPPEYDDKKTLRYIVSVPKRYLVKGLLPKPLTIDDDDRIVANSIRFAVKYPSLEPADDAWSKGSFRVQVGNITEDGISKSVDGTWPNYYSGYNVNLPDEHGLHVRSRKDALPFMPHRLYFLITREQNVRIECQVNLNEADKWCVMNAKRPGEPYLETGFYSVEMPRWRERLDRLSTLFRTEGKKALGTVRPLQS